MVSGAEDVCLFEPCHGQQSARGPAERAAMGSALVRCLRRYRSRRQTSDVYYAGAGPRWGGQMALTDEAITTLRGMIQSGELPPGSRLPPEHQLATQMGLSRSGVREAVKVLEAARVLDVRRGDGTYVTSLAPALLLEGVGVAVELLQGETLLEVMEVRRLLEPAATGLACLRATDAQLDKVEALLLRMRD